MADIKISQLPSATTPLAGTEEVPLVQSGTTKKVTVSNLRGSGVTAVTATAPVVSSGGTTPVISMAAATTSVNGYLTSTDWNTFNNKQPAGSYLVSGGALGTPSSGTATNLTGLPLTTGVTGTLPVANGGTGTASPSIVAGTNVTVTGTWPNQTINSTSGGGSGTVTSVAATVPSFLSVTGSPITTSGTLAIAYSGTALPIANGGTNATTATAARGNILPAYAGNAGKVLAVNVGATDVEYISAGGTGTVTSVAVSGGTTGLTTSGGPITAAGTITLGGTLAVASGGTGTATPSLVQGTNVTITGSWPNQTINATASGSGTVTSVGGTGTVNGLTLTGTVTTSGNLTLGGTLDLSAPPAIGGTTPAAITGTIVTANTKVVSPFFDAVNSAGGALRNASGTSQIQWGGGGGNNVSVDVSTNLNGTNAQIDISPTGTGHVHINPTGSGSVEIKPTSAGTINNMAIGGITPAAGAFTTLSATTAIGVASGGTGVTTSTGTGSVVLSTSPTLVTPALGTPSALVGTNITGTAAGLTAGNVTTNANLTGAVTSVGNATSLGSFSSANLAGALTDETGSGSAVFATSPTLVTPILGTPTSATLTNATGLPISTGVSGLGTGVATFLATPSSANLAATVTGETGSGGLVFAVTPALTNPTITAYTETVYALSGTAIDPANGTIQTKTLGASTTFTESLADGQSVVLMVNPVTYTVTWPTITWINTSGSGSAPTLEASSTNVVVLWQVASTVYGNWVGSA
jgi:hypothetical protein